MPSRSDRTALADRRAMEVEANQQNPLDGRNKIDRGDYFIHGMSGGSAVPSSGLSMRRGGKKCVVDEAALRGMVELVLNHLKEGHKLPEIKKQLKLEHPHATAKNIADAVRMGKSEMKGAGGGPSKLAASRRGRRSAVVSPGAMELAPEKVAESRPVDVIEVVDEKKAKCCLPKKGRGATPSMGLSMMRGGNVVKASTAAKRAVNRGLANGRALEEQDSSSNPLEGGMRRSKVPPVLLKFMAERLQKRKLTHPSKKKAVEFAPPNPPFNRAADTMRRKAASTETPGGMVYDLSKEPEAGPGSPGGRRGVRRTVPPAPAGRRHKFEDVTGSGKKRLSKEEFLARMAAGKAKKRGGAKRKLEDESYGEMDEYHPGDKFLSDEVQEMLRSKARAEKKKRVDARITAAPRTQAMVKAAVEMVKEKSGKGLVGGTKREQWKVRAKKIFEQLWSKNKGQLQNDDDDEEDDDEKFDELWDKLQDEAMVRAARELKYNPDSDDKAWRPAGKVKYDSRGEPVYGRGYDSDSSSSGSDSDDSMCGGRKSGMKFIKDVVAHMKVGAFTKEAKRHKMEVEEFADEVLAHPKKYKLTTRRRAQFLVNIRRKKGGAIDEFLEAKLREPPPAVKGGRRGRGYYVEKPPPTAPPAQQPSIGQKIRNELVNPESKFRSKILPGAQTISEYAEIPLDVAGAVLMNNPILGSQVRMSLQGINAANKSVGKLQKGEVLQGAQELFNQYNAVRNVLGRRGGAKKSKAPALKGDTLVLEGGKKKRAKASPSDGRRKRASIVAEVMKKRGVSMIQASSIVKKEGLY